MLRCDSANIDDGTYGIHADEGGKVRATSANINSASSDGILSDLGGFVNFASGTCTNSGGFGFHANNQSIINAVGVTTSGHSSGNYSPATGADGNDNSRILV